MASALLLSLIHILRELLQSLHQKKRYHRLRDGSLLRLDDSLEGLDDNGHWTGIRALDLSLIHI